MPDRENVLGRIHIAVAVRDTTRTARPFSYSKPCDTSRPRFGQTATTRTRLGGVCRVDFLKNNACVSAPIVQHCFTLKYQRPRASSLKLAERNLYWLKPKLSHTLK